MHPTRWWAGKGVSGRLQCTGVGREDDTLLGGQKRHWGNVRRLARLVAQHLHHHPGLNLRIAPEQEGRGRQCR